MIVHLLRLRVLPRDRINAIRTLQSTIGPTKARQGCLSCSFYSHIDNDDELLLVQKWSSQEVLDNYLLSPIFSLLVEGIELSTEEPLIEFHRISDTSGLEYAEKIRLGAIASAVG